MEWLWRNQSWCTREPAKIYEMKRRARDDTRVRRWHFHFKRGDSHLWLSVAMSHYSDNHINLAYIADSLKHTGTRPDNRGSIFHAWLWKHHVLILAVYYHRCDHINVSKTHNCFSQNYSPFNLGQVMVSARVRLMHACPSRYCGWDVSVSFVVC